MPQDKPRIITKDNQRRIINGEYATSELTTLDDFFAYTQNSGSIAQAGSDILYGINQTKTTGAVPVNKDAQGFVFFTRPMLNLNKWNVLNNRTFHSLLTNDATSVHRYVRCMLDPSLKNYATPTVSSPLVDNKLVFIPLLTNTIIKLSGWPDVVAPVFTSKGGVRKEQWAVIDGTTEINETFDLDATFKNIVDEPTSLLFKTWINYASYVFDGQLKPYAGFEARNEIDYTTRIYRIVLDKTGRFVSKIACTIASFPMNDPTGKFFDYDRTQQYMDQTKEINVRFKCMGAVYNDEIIVKWFNKASGYTNSELAKVVKSNFKSDGSHKYELIPRELLDRFKYRGYPLINTNTFELEWWIDTQSEGYKNVLSSLKRTSVLTTNLTPEF